MTVVFDPDNWVTSIFRTLKDYIETNAEERAAGIYEIIGNFPTDDIFKVTQPFPKTIIHFEYDDIRNPMFGFGDNVVDDQFDIDLQQVTPVEAQVHTANFDVGIWASSQSGGDTARMVAFQLLSDIFVGVMAFRDLRDNRGIEILSFNGGNFMQEEIDDLSVWRVSGMTLVVRVFSRRTPFEPIPVVGDVTIEPQVIIDPDGLIIGN